MINTFSDPLIVHHILSPNKIKTKQEGKPERIFPELDIPLPVTEENKDEYLAELDKISAAELWIDKHSADTNISTEMIGKYVMILLTANVKTRFETYLTMVYWICISIIVDYASTRIFCTKHWFGGYWFGHICNFEGWQDELCRL